MQVGVRSSVARSEGRIAGAPGLLRVGLKSPHRQGVQRPASGQSQTSAAWRPNLLLILAQGAVVPITDGIPGAAQEVSGTFRLFGAACPEATSCQAVGFAYTSSGSIVGVLVTIT